MFSFFSAREPSQVRQESPTLTDLLHDNYKDSKIELRKNTAGKIELTATKPGFFEHLVYSFRAYFYPETTRKEKNETTKLLAEIIKAHFGTNHGPKIAKTFKKNLEIKENESIYDRNSEGSYVHHSPVLTSRLRGAQLKVTLIDQIEKTVLQSYSDKNGEKEIVKRFYRSHFKNKYNLPTESELTDWKKQTQQKIYLQEQSLYLERPIITAAPKEFLNVQGNPEEVLRLLPTLSKSNQEKLLNRVTIFETKNPDVFKFVIDFAKKLNQEQPRPEELAKTKSSAQALINKNKERIERQKTYTAALREEVKSNPVNAAQRVTEPNPSKTPLLSPEALDILEAIINKCTTLIEE